jgi:hypothetical protein
MGCNQQFALYFDPPSQCFLGDSLFGIHGAGHGGDQIRAPYAYFKEYLQRLGVQIRGLEAVGERLARVYRQAIRSFAEQLKAGALTERAAPPWEGHRGTYHRAAN